MVQRGSSQAPSRVPMSDVLDNRRVESIRATNREWRWLDEMIQDDIACGDRVGHADHRVQRGRPQRRGCASRVASGGPGDRPTEQIGAGSQEVPFTHVSSSQIYHEIHGQMYDDLTGLTFTMDMDDQISFGMTTLGIFSTRPTELGAGIPAPDGRCAGVPPRYGGDSAVPTADV
ncbi:hypothetical protein Ahy_A01g003268 isoform B [Arachis hypogaea]|uniref:Uncharacterized protein n=1 Tax=Arachis hypogaea TaxID=3818 RepID=A0A445ESS9_ARAHY|nr:hypothetical protein Ahy_A01g003268 isoform B [Arachis hypogaea]